ncbi:conserved hypothetical protein [Desulfofarcimen acetoxidans DSM 771]|jgi:hypothetical protein|uniref:DUF2007 domain-containing protein n=1 Tax=Desulfofarcimen acetoxidans (strain ATCC 49208 / DSM 771 / KCTC 5769 / VKM B-1644 / 5575) TaxID=485916 RepID=C8W030_DESAS|nr:DUF2007 domain-containing protein [Desulfofarcimen acetoxidans]ACV64998.1 conserved hypothetical protein [Desulfofarcimen acetoxidans DSM 771]
MDKLVTLRTFFDATEAHIIKSLLESEGIKAHLLDEHSATYVYSPITIGGIRLVVHQSDIEAAKEILSSMD